MPSAANLKLVISADGSQARSELAATGASAESFQASIGKVGEQMQSVGTKMALVGVGLDAAIGVSAAMAGKFQEDTVALVHGAGESKDALAQVTQGLLDMATRVGETPDKLAQGMYLVESAGYHGAAGLQVMQAAAEGARIGMADQATVADAVTSALNAYHLSADDATGVTGQLIQTVASGKMHFQDLASSLGTVLPAAATAHVSLQEVGAALATMTMQGTPAADAATYLRQTLLQLQNPTAKAQKAIESLGFGAHDLANMLNEKGLLATLTAVQDALQKKFPQGGAAATATLADIVGGTKSMQAALELTGGNLSTFAANIKNVGDRAAGVTKFEDDWALVSTTAAQKFDQLKASMAVMAIQLGTALLPALENLMAIVSPLVQKVADFAKAHGDLVAKVLLGAAAFFTLGGVLLTVLGTVALVVAALNPVTLIVLAIVAVVGLLAAAWATDFGGIHEITAAVLGFVTGQVRDQIALFNYAWPIIRAAVETAFHAIQTVVEDVLNAVVPFIQTEIGTITDWWTAHHQQIQQITDSTFRVIQAIVQAVLPIVQAVISTYLDISQRTFAVAWAAIQQIVSAAWEIIKVVVDTTIHDVLDIIDIAMDLLTGNWSDAWSKLGDLLTTNWQAFGDIVKTGVNLIIGFIDDLIGAWDELHLKIPGFSVAIPSINVPGVGTIGGGTLSWGGFDESVSPLAKIPLLAAGGIAFGPTLAMIGEAGPEAVVPLGQSAGIIDYDRLGTAVAKALANHPTYAINATYGSKSDERRLIDDVRMLQMLGAAT